MNKIGYETKTALDVVFKDMIKELLEQTEQKRSVGKWCLKPNEKMDMYELQNVTLALDPRYAVPGHLMGMNLGTLVETEDYLLGLNPGYTHYAWPFYEQWLDGGKYPYTYGHRIHAYPSGCGVSQYNVIVKKLKKDPLTRHAVVPMWNPQEDHFNDFVPCTLLWYFQVNHGQLDMYTVMRCLCI